VKKTFLLLLPAFLLSVFLLASCEEVSEVTAYDNWKERNEAVIDSLSSVAGNLIVRTAKEADEVGVGRLFALETAESTNYKKEYVYCMKISENQTGVRPYYTDVISAYYCGSDINGRVFDKNFDGYRFIDRNFSATDRQPSEFDSKITSYVKTFVEGWVTALQYMREGERWMIYVPYKSGYGEDGTSTIKGYSVITFDTILEDVVSEH